MNDEMAHITIDALDHLTHTDCGGELEILWVFENIIMFKCIKCKRKIEYRGEVDCYEDYDPMRCIECEQKDECLFYTPPAKGER